MQITIKTVLFKEKLESVLKEYDEKYEVLTKLYRHKMGEYIKELDKQVEQIVQGSKLEITIFAPHREPNRRNTIIKALKAVSMHAKDTLEMSDREYNDIISAIETEITSLHNAYSNLGGTAEGGSIFYK